MGEPGKQQNPMSLYSLTSMPIEEPERRAGEKNVGELMVTHLFEAAEDKQEEMTEARNSRKQGWPTRELPIPTPPTSGYTGLRDLLK